MSIKQRIKEDVVLALKAGKSEDASVLRMALSALATKEKEKRYAIAKEKPEMSEEELTTQSQLSEAEMIDTVASEVKKRRDAIALYEKGGRPELATGEQAEIVLLQKYLPEQLSAEELKSLIDAAIAKTGAKEIKDMGRVMVELAPSIKGKADSAQVAKIIKESLNG